MPTCRVINCHLPNEKVCHICQCYFCNTHFPKHNCVATSSDELSEFDQLRQKKNAFAEQKRLIRNEIHQTRFAFLEEIDFFSQAKWLDDNQGTLASLVRLEKTKWVPNYTGWGDFQHGWGFSSTFLRDYSTSTIRFGWFRLIYRPYRDVIELQYQGRTMFRLDTKKRLVNSWRENSEWVGDWLEMWNHLYSVVVAKLRKEVTLLEQEVQELEFNGAN